jgi:hypothetical protein
VLGKALSLFAVSALVAAGAAEASTLSRVWFGHTARGGDLSFLRAGKRIHRVQVELPVTCTNEVESTSRDSTVQIGFDKVVRTGADRRIHTTQRYDSSLEHWTLTFDGTLGATKARGKLAWTYERSSSDATICRGKGSSRWTARRGRAVADPF